MQQKLLFRNYPGKNDIEKAMACLSESDSGFKALTRLEQVRRAGDLVRMATGPEAVKEVKKAEAAANGGGGAVEKFQAALEKLDDLVTAAIDEDDEGAGQIIEALAQRVLARRTAKTGSPAVTASAIPYAAYPGRNDIEKAQSWLCQTRPGFKLRDRQQQIRLASAFASTLASKGGAEAERVLMARMGES